MSPKDQAAWCIAIPRVWPAPPDELSVSTWLDIEECPRRWALSAAEYPELWGGHGYPPKLQIPALAGSVAHLALEIITRELTRSGISSLKDPAAPQVLRDLGGYTNIVEQCVERILKRFRDNPRAAVMFEHAQRNLRGQVPALRSRVQSMLSCVRLPGGLAIGTSSSTSPTSRPAVRRPLARGAYPELEVRARRIGWKGKVDLLVLDDAACEITDFKTGVPDEVHKFQIKAYAVMWRLDEELNPSGRVASRLTLVYESHDVQVAPPTEQEIDALSRELMARREAAASALAARPPEAHPDSVRCRTCGVRHLCDAYWAAPSRAVTDDGRFGDIEVKITGRHGITSWDAEIVRTRDPSEHAALLRLQQPTEFTVGTRVRVIDGAITRDSEDPSAPIIITLGVLSEAYCVC